MNLRTYAQGDIEHRRVLVRVDFNVPLDHGRVTDDSRLKAEVETIASLTAAGARVILISHLGRPKGKVVPDLSLRPVAAELAGLLGTPVSFCDASYGSDAQRAAAEALDPGDVLLLENLRFDPREEANDPALAEELRSLADVFIQDAFGVVHRAHASTVAVAEAFGDGAYAGPLLDREVRALWQLLERPQRPFIVIAGGAKVSDKIGALSRLSARADYLLLGGALANTFMAAAGLAVGNSRTEPDQIRPAQMLLRRLAGRVLLPASVMVAKEPEGPSREVPADQVGPDDIILDIGPGAVSAWRRVLASTKTLFWNGPMGLFEVPAFSEGTRAVAAVVAGLDSAYTVVGGGDSLAALHRLKVPGHVSHESTGGGASLELLEGRVLPGLERVTLK